MATRRTRQHTPSPPLVVRWLLACALGVLASSALAERVLEVIPLQYRLVFEVIPVLQPLLDPRGTLTGTDNQLIVRTTRENLAEIKAALVGIDVRLRQLKISVTQDLAAVATTDQNALSGALGTDHAEVHVTTAHTHSLEDDRNLHFVLTMEGQPAYVETGQALPYGYESSTVTPYGADVASGTAYAHTASGIYVTPHVHEDRVTLEIAPQLERIDPAGSGAIETHRASTTVSGRLGEWIALGGTSNAVGTTEAELVARTRRQGDNTYSVWVRVDEQR